MNPAITVSLALDRPLVRLHDDRSVWFRDMLSEPGNDAQRGRIMPGVRR